MPSDDNTVNINSRTGRYHHGDLRAALIEHGLAELALRPPDEVSLREIARRAGVSATAVYRHFPDKAALLGALCQVGGAQLSEAFRTAMAKTEGGKAAFSAMGRAYVRFALANPSLFRLIMTHPPPPDGAPEQVQKAWDRRLDMVATALDGLMPADSPPEIRRVRQLQAWSLVHGLAMLMLDGQVPADDSLIDQVIEANFV
ncbi:MAG: TetR/AcrR family transcriptional regulator [Hyphomonas sp.]